LRTLIDRPSTGATSCCRLRHLTPPGGAGLPVALACVGLAVRGSLSAAVEVPTLQRMTYKRYAIRTAVLVRSWSLVISGKQPSEAAVWRTWSASTMRGYLESGFAELAVAGVVTGTPAFLLAEGLLGRFGDGERDVLLGAAGIDDLGGGVIDADAGGDSCARAGEALVEFAQGLEGALDPFMAGGLVAVLLGAGVHPDVRCPSLDGNGAGATCQTCSGSPRRLPGRRTASVNSGVLVLIQSRSWPSWRRVLGSTVTNRPPCESMWLICSRVHNFESAT